MLGQGYDVRVGVDHDAVTLQIRHLSVTDSRLVSGGRVRRIGVLSLVHIFKFFVFALDKVAVVFLFLFILSFAFLTCRLLLRCQFCFLQLWEDLQTALEDLDASSISNPSYLIDRLVHGSKRRIDDLERVEGREADLAVPQLVPLRNGFSADDGALALLVVRALAAQVVAQQNVVVLDRVCTVAARADDLVRRDVALTRGDEERQRRLVLVLVTQQMQRLHNDPFARQDLCVGRLQLLAGLDLLATRTTPALGFVGFHEGQVVAQLRDLQGERGFSSWCLAHIKTP